MTGIRKGGLADYALIVLLAAIFGSNFMMTKIAVAEVQPLTIVAARLVIAAAFLVIVAFAARVAWPSGGIWWPILLSAVFGNTLPFFLITWGQEVVDAGLAAIFMAIMPLCTILIAHLVTDDEKLGFWVVTGFLMALAGVVVLFGVDKLAQFDGTSLRQYALLAAAMCYGINAVITKRLTGLPWQSMAAAQVVLAAAVTLPFIMLSGSGELWPEDVSVGAAASIVYTGIMPTAVGAIMLLLIIKRAGASFLSQINFMVPLFGVGFAMLFLGERLPANAALALALILCGVALSRRRPRSAIRPVNKAV